MSHSRALPVSVINHNTVIPKNNERYHETFNTVIMPRDLVYKITSITCKIDTTSLWNIRAMNVVKVQMLSGYEMVYNVGPGYYSITELCRAIADSIQVDDVNRAYLNSDVATAVDLSGAPDYTSILKLEGVVGGSNVAASEPYDITNGMSVIRVYSSINAQTFGLKSPLIDNLIHVSMGLNNMITWDDLAIDVIEQSNLDYIDWILTDANDRPISLNSNVYISFTISCYTSSVKNG